MKYAYYAASLLLLAGCGDTTVKETLGLDRRAPDEFRVVSRPPLSVPPQFDLRPPGVEGASTQPTTRDKAQSLVLSGDSSGKTNKKNSGPSSADSVFLDKAGASQADPDVKKELSEKKINDQLQKEEQSWWDKVTTLPGHSEPVVKAEDEAERLKKNQESGKPVTEGATPETGGGQGSVLQRWFGGE